MQQLHSKKSYRLLLLRKVRRQRLKPKLKPMRKLRLTLKQPRQLVSHLLKSRSRKPNKLKQSELKMRG